MVSDTDEGRSMVGDVKRARLVIAEDDVLLRAGLVSLLERSGFEVCGQASEASELMSLVSSYKAEPYPLVISKRIPRGQVILGRWALVEATDGPVGRLRSLVVGSDDAEITHLVVLTHHFLSRQEVAVPVGHVKNIFSDYILLRMNRRAIENLPHLALNDPITLLDPSDEDLVPEDPGDAGVKAVGTDASHQEAAHLLMDEVGPRLRARGFSDEQILEWAKAFLRAEHSGGADEFLDWIHGQEHELKVRRYPLPDGESDRTQPGLGLQGLDGSS